MPDRSILGPADVGDEVLLDLVAAQHGRRPRALVDVDAREVDYDLDAITTGGRYRVRGEAEHDDGTRAFSFFVKVVHEWSRSPHFAAVPEEAREWAARSVPWRTEPLAYRSDLATRLPAGLGMPRAFHVADLDDTSAVVWLEDLATLPVRWDVPRYRTAAHLLGRLAASRDVAPLAGLGGLDWTVATYLQGRVRMQVVPMVRDPATWRHPLIAAAFPVDLQERLLAAVDRLDELGAELCALPTLTGHGDACPNNLLAVVGRDDIVLIDFGFWNPLPVGFDLGQLLVGDVQIGRRRAPELGGLAALDDHLVAAYVDGLRDEGVDLPADLVRRAHALQLFVFTGMSAFPWEHLGAPVTDELLTLAGDRAALTTYSLDLLEATEPG
ncbi:phosphotransferase [Nocardioides mangrovi]|uniref:Aminoglycoside phosphotransferase domain-containing protein n=1 Tax=Nocardioides mangrovi TaxID=2874580 RepID=A0ABS7UH99_9ACTN|nr:phosphotransferase [Nocardioides mangrovi]MBZ5740411.1 hypothetical protein [Nocardioides mangrovi]